VQTIAIGRAEHCDPRQAPSHIFSVALALRMPGLEPPVFFRLVGVSGRLDTIGGIENAKNTTRSSPDRGSGKESGAAVADLRIDPLKKPFPAAAGVEIGGLWSAAAACSMTAKIGGITPAVFIFSVRCRGRPSNILFAETWTAADTLDNSRPLRRVHEPRMKRDHRDRMMTKSGDAPVDKPP